MWHDIEGHDEVADRFRRVMENDRLASTYLFVGPAGIGKRLFAIRLAQALMCQTTAGRDLQFCGTCDSCRLMVANNHPDLLAVELPEGRQSLPIELFVGDREHRHQTGLCHHLSLKPFFGRRRVAVIDDADSMNQESANALLKTLEEPPPGSLLVLIGTSASRQLPTIRSRAQLVQFKKLSDEATAHLLLATGIATAADEAARLAGVCEGSLQQARTLADPELWRFRQDLVAWLEASALDVLRTTQAVLEFVDSAGTEASARRLRLRTLIEFAAAHYREAMRNSQAELGIDQLDHCLLALEHIDRNANQATLVHWWVEGLATPRQRLHVRI